jgi:hypothetical protein
MELNADGGVLDESVGLFQRVLGDSHPLYANSLIHRGGSTCSKAITPRPKRL